MRLQKVIFAVTDVSGQWEHYEFFENRWGQWEHYAFLTTRQGTVPKPGTVPLRAVSLRAGSRSKP